MAAILQFEIDRKRVGDYSRDRSTAEGSAKWKYERLLRHALNDTLTNGGTFVVVVSDDKITAVQRPEAEDFV